MQLDYPRLSLFYLFLTFLVGGCTTLQTYRNKFGAEDQCTTSTSEPARCAEYALQTVKIVDEKKDLAGTYHLGFIEFDDQGHLLHREQMNKVIRPLEEQAGRGDLLMVVFAHGWKHNANGDPEDPNIETFRKVMEQIARAETKLSEAAEQPPRMVVGVYLGWRGLSLEWPVLKELTFWDRKSTAHKVGDVGVAEVLMRLENIKSMRSAYLSGEQKPPAKPIDKSPTKPTDKSPTATTDRTRLVVVGHSFGGAIVFSALAHNLEQKLAQMEGAGLASTVAQGYGDLTILVNPAFEAIRFSTLSDMAYVHGTYLRDQLPVLAIFTSEADNATGTAFPLGRWFSTVFEKEKDYVRKNPATKTDQRIDEEAANRQAVGHFTPFQTHSLNAVSAMTANQASMNGPELLKAAIEFRDAWTNGKESLPFGPLRLDKSGDAPVRDPYLVVRVDKLLIKDHNDLDNQLMLDFVKGLILLKSQPEGAMRELKAK